MKKLSKLFIVPIAAMALSGCEFLDKILQRSSEETPTEEGEKPSGEQTPEVQPSVSLNHTSLNIKVGEEATLVATTANGSGSVVWTSSDEEFATVSQAGVVTAIKEGTATITATYSGKTATCTVTISPEDAKIVKSVVLSPASLSLDMVDNKTATLTPTVVADEGVDTTITWESSDSTVVTVSAESGSATQAITVTAHKKGTAKITATCGGVKAECSVTVKGIEDIYSFSGMLENENIAIFKDNANNESGKFRGATSPIMEVGDYNAFVMKPTLSILDEDFNPAPESAWDFDYLYTAKEYDEATSAYVDLKGEYFTFDAEKCEFLFNESARGKQLKLDVTPGGLTDAQKAIYHSEIEVIVNQGYNVYTANDLAYFNNVEFPDDARQDGSILKNGVGNAAWKKFRLEHGMSETYVAENVYLQSNIKIVKENLPIEFFYTAEQVGTHTEAVGMMIDSTDVYARIGEEFTFNGNYFGINTADLEQGGFDCMAEGNPLPDNISHSTLFKVCELRNDPSVNSNFTFKNCTYYGNAPRTDIQGDETKNLPERFGLIFFKVQNYHNANPLKVHSLFENFNVTRSCISFYTEYGPSEMTIKDCKITEGYANGIYMYRKGDLVVQNTEMRNFGGPIIVTDASAQWTDPGFTVTADEASVFDNWVAGQEPWFINTGASGAIAAIQGADPLVQGTSGGTRSFLKVNDENPLQQLMNMVVVNYGERPYMTFQKGSGSRIGVQGPDSVGGATVVSLQGNNTHFYSDAGGDVVFDGVSPTVNAPLLGNYLNMAQFNSSFGFISMIFELTTPAA